MTKIINWYLYQVAIDFDHCFKSQILVTQYMIYIYIFFFSFIYFNHKHITMIDCYKTCSLQLIDLYK